MITYSATHRIFKIDTGSTTYAFKVAHERYLVHLYYGKKVSDFDALDAMYYERTVSFAPYPSDLGNSFSLDTVLTELSFFDSGDNRDTAVKVEHEGSCVTAFDYRNYKIYGGRIAIEGMPYSRGGDETLEIVYSDEVSGVELHSYYVVFVGSDTIGRFNKFINRGEKPVVLRNVMSCQLDFLSGDFKLGYLAGRYRKERNYVENLLNIGLQRMDSKRGHSSHQFNPFAVLKAADATERSGEAYGVELVYSGDFEIQAEKTFAGKVRLLAGLNRETFSWRLTSQESFFTPEVIITYSADGLGQLSRNFHDHLREHIIDRKFVRKKRPIVINSWEAAGFDVNEALLLEYAEKSKGTGIDTLVIDDGWFGQRNDDSHGLGDWTLNREKFPSGLKAFSEKVHALGLDLGIWIEPEMVNPDSDLYRAHPDWVLGSPDRRHSLGRGQLVLDLCNDEAIAYVVESLAETLRGVKLEYIKWDFNRSLSEACSRVLPEERRGETKHRFQLGSYKMHKMLTEAFPDVLFEGCSGGGGRFDAGMLFYCPQIWTSDNTDPVDRIDIQHGTSLAYPLSAISAHVSDTVTNKIEIGPDYGFRFAVASCGVLGYEFDVRKLSENDKEQIATLNLMYRKIDDLILEGDLFRSENAMSMVAKDKSRAYIVCFNTDARERGCLPFEGLTQGTYTDLLSQTVYKTDGSVGVAAFDFNGEKFRCFLLEKA